MKFVFRLMLFSIILNFAVGIMQTAIPAFSDDVMFQDDSLYDANYADTFITNNNASINPTAVSGGSIGTDESNLWDRIGLGKMTAFIDSAEKYAYGFINFLEKTVGQGMENGLRSIVFSTLKTLLTIGYVLGVFYLFTGKSFKE